MPSPTIWRGRILVITAPSKLISPASGFNRPEIIAKVVLLPAPLGPMKPNISPAPILRFKLATATKSP